MSSENNKKFGTIKGVLIPNITMMFGVILFLRLGVLTAHSGSFQMLAAIALSLVIMTCTSFSIGSLATNMHVGNGGVYYIISRTLGIEIGGAVGLGIYFAQLISITLTVSGFSLSICEIFPEYSLKSVEFLTLTALALISGVSASWALKLQGAILALLLAAIGSILMGSSANLDTTHVSATPFYAGGSLTFWQTFAMFYPAMTGIEAGMALSGSLKNPGKSLYRGNLYSLIFVALCYSGLTLFSALRIPHAILLSDPFSYVDFSISPKLVYLGIWGATLSSAMGCLLGAPRMLHSMAEDGIVFGQLRKVYGRMEEPRIALFVTYALVAFILYFTTIDQIIPMLAMICLVTYGLLNLVTACAELMNSPSWRPRMRTHWKTSLAGFLLIIVAMFMTAPGWAFATLVILASIQVLLQFRDLETGFQDLRESLIFFVSRLALYRLGQPSEHALTWHPQFLVFIVAPTQQEKLILLSQSLTRRSGILSFAIIVPEEWQTQERLQSLREWFKSYMDKKKIACLSEIYPAPNTSEGYTQLIKAYGIGAIQPNTVVLEISEDKIDLDLIDIIETCCCMQKNLVLVRSKDSVSKGVFTRKRTSRKKKIDVWWDPDETSNFDLTMSLVTTLTDGLVFGGANITIKAIVNDENAQAPVHEYLRAYQERSRIKSKILVSSDESMKSSSPHLCFVSLKAMENDPTDEQKNVYMAYLRETLQNNFHWDTVLFVTSYDHVDHRAIYLPQS